MPIGQSSFALVYTAKDVLPIERTVLTSWIRKYEPGRNEELLQAQLDLLEEDRIEIAIRKEVYRRRMMRYYNKRVCHRDFQVGDMVPRKTTLNARNLVYGKLGAN